MNPYQNMLAECSAKFAETTEYSSLINYRTRQDRLTMDDKLRIAKSIEHAFAPVLNPLKADVPALSDSDLLFCILSTLHIENMAIAEMLAISIDTVRVRKYRLRDKLPQRWFEMFFSDGSAGGVASQEPVVPSSPGGFEAVGDGGARRKVSFMKAVENGFRNYLNVSARASRSEFWYLWIFAAVAFIAVNYAILCTITATYKYIEPLDHELFRHILYGIQALIAVILAIPMYTVGVRRLHDCNIKGWWALILCLLPLALVIAIKVYRVVCYEDLVCYEIFYQNDYLITTVVSNFILMLLLAADLLVFSRPGTIGPNDFGAEPQ
jgi:uncharacterized membrane protein YhaH (DUF805 family)